MHALRTLALVLGLLGLVSAPAGIAPAQATGGPPPVVPLTIDFEGVFGEPLGSADAPALVPFEGDVLSTSSILAIPFVGTVRSGFTRYRESETAVADVSPNTTITTDLGILLRLQCQLNGDDPANDPDLFIRGCTVTGHAQPPEPGCGLAY